MHAYVEAKQLARASSAPHTPRPSVQCSFAAFARARPSADRRQCKSVGRVETVPVRAAVWIAVRPSVPLVKHGSPCARRVLQATDDPIATNGAGRVPLRFWLRTAARSALGENFRGKLRARIGGVTHALLLHALADVVHAVCKVQTTRIERESSREHQTRDRPCGAITKKCYCTRTSGGLVPHHRHALQQRLARPSK